MKINEISKIMNRLGIQVGNQRLLREKLLQTMQKNFDLIISSLPIFNIAFLRCLALSTRIAL